MILPGRERCKQKRAAAAGPGCFVDSLWRSWYPNWGDFLCVSGRGPCRGTADSAIRGDGRLCDQRDAGPFPLWLVSASTIVMSTVSGGLLGGAGDCVTK